MEDKTAVICAALMMLCLIYIAVRLLQKEEVPGFAIGFAGALCGILIRCVYEKRKK